MGPDGRQYQRLGRIFDCSRCGYGGGAGSRRLRLDDANRPGPGDVLGRVASFRRCGGRDKRRPRYRGRRDGHRCGNHGHHLRGC